MARLEVILSVKKRKMLPNQKETQLNLLVFVCLCEWECRERSF